MSIFTIYIKKANKSLDIDFDSLPPHVQAHIIEYGLKQKVNDCHASEDNPDTAWALVQALASRLQEGDITKRAGGRSPSEIELDNLLSATLKQIGRPTKEIKDLGREERISLIAKFLSKDASLVEKHFIRKAEEIVAAKTIDTSDITLD